VGTSIFSGQRLDVGDELENGIYSRRLNRYALDYMCGHHGYVPFESSGSVASDGRCFCTKWNSVSSVRLIVTIMDEFAVDQ
jgi:hypothetical protein